MIPHLHSGQVRRFPPETRQTLPDFQKALSFSEVSRRSQRLCQRENGHGCVSDFPRFGSGFAALWLLGAAGAGSAARPGREHSADPHFGALRREKGQRPSVLPDDRISKLVMQRSICRFCCVSVVWFCVLCLALSICGAHDFLVFFFCVLICYSHDALFKKGFPDPEWSR